MKFQHLGYKFLVQSHDKTFPWIWIEQFRSRLENEKNSYQMGVHLTWTGCNRGSTDLATFLICDIVGPLHLHLYCASNFPMLPQSWPCFGASRQKRDQRLQRRWQLHRQLNQCMALLELLISMTFLLCRASSHLETHFFGGILQFSWIFNETRGLICLILFCGPKRSEKGINGELYAYEDLMPIKLNHANFFANHSIFTFH